MDMKKILQALDGVSTDKKPVEYSNDIKRSLQIVTEGSNPHKVSLPVQMAMQHYQEVDSTKKSTSLLERYFAEAEEELTRKATEQKEQRKALIRNYAEVIAERVRLKNQEDTTDESLRTENPCWKGYKPVGTKKKDGKTVPNCVPKK